MWNKLKYFLIFKLCFFSGSFYAQDRVSIEANIGKIVHHKEGLLYNVPDLTGGITLHYIKEADVSSKCAKFWGYPDFYYSLSYTRFGDDEVLGSAYSALLGISFKILSTDLYKLNFYTSTGLAYIDRIYHEDLNPTNNAIGSHINSTSRFAISNTFNINNRIDFRLGGGMIHFSNARTRSPNSGINAFTVDVGMNYKIGLKQNLDRDIEHLMDTTSSKKSFYLDLFYTYGITNSSVPGGPQYHLDIFGAGLGYAISPFLNLLLGYEYDYNHLLFHFHLRNFRSRAESNQLAKRNILYVGSELMFSNIGFRNQIGLYLPFFNRENPDNIYFKLMLIYYPFGHQNKISPYIGASMKSHFGVAEHVGLNIGCKMALF